MEVWTRASWEYYFLLGLRISVVGDKSSPPTFIMEMFKMWFDEEDEEIRVGDEEE